MLNRILLRISIALAFILLIAVSWIMFSFICFIGISIILIVDPGMVTSEMAETAMWGGAIATTIAMASGYWNSRDYNV